MFEGHDPYLVALSVVIAILGGYSGFGITARIRGTPDASHRLLWAGAAFFLAIGIWTMHFVGMLAAPLPAGTVYLVLPTIISFLICALVVGISLFFVSTGEPSLLRVVSSAVLLGVGVGRHASGGLHGLSGRLARAPDRPTAGPCWGRIFPGRTPAAPPRARGCGRPRSAAWASGGAPRPHPGCGSRVPTAPISSIPPMSGASAPTPITPRSMTAPASGCVRGRS